MNRQQLEALREWVKSEIAANDEANEEDESGYRGCSNYEQQHADSCFDNLLNTFTNK